MTSIKTTVTYKFNDKMEDTINKIFDAGIGLISKELVNKAEKKVAVDTGALQKSITHYQVGKLVWNFAAGGPTVPYAVLQELGHLKGFKYKFTPFMRPSVQEITGVEMDKAFADKLKGTTGFAESLTASRAISSIPL